MLGLSTVWLSAPIRSAMVGKFMLTVSMLFPNDSGIDLDKRGRWPARLEGLVSDAGIKVLTCMEGCRVPAPLAAIRASAFGRVPGSYKDWYDASDGTTSVCE